MSEDGQHGEDAECASCRKVPSLKALIHRAKCGPCIENEWVPSGQPQSWWQHLLRIGLHTRK